MVHYHVRTYSAAVSGSTVRKVQCEKCARDYEYQLSRRVVGYASAILPWSRRAKMEAIAAKKAAAKLERQLLSAVDPIACPGCGWFQMSMVEEMKRRRLRAIYTLGIATFLIAIIGACVFLVFRITGVLTEPDGIQNFWIGFVCALVLASISLGTRWASNRRFDPNAQRDGRK